MCVYIYAPGVCLAARRCELPGKTRRKGRSMRQERGGYACSSLFFTARGVVRTANTILVRCRQSESETDARFHGGLGRGESRIIGLRVIFSSSSRVEGKRVSGVDGCKVVYVKLRGLGRV